MLTAQMAHVKARMPVRSRVFALWRFWPAWCLPWPRRQTGQAAKSSLSKTEGRNPSEASSRVAQRHEQAISENDWREEITRNASAPVTIFEFFDYQCPFCFKTDPALAEAIRNHHGKVRLVLKHLPLSIHPDSALAHQAALAAGEQGRFWEMHDLLFANQSKIKLPDLLHYAQQLHLNVPRFQKALESGRFRHVIDDDRAMARGLGISSTPAFFINGQSFIGQLSASRLNAAIDQALNPTASATVSAPGTVSLPTSIL